MLQTLPMTSTTTLHLSLNVTDVEKSVVFYRILFNKEPAKHYADYAKFELEEPPLALSLIPMEHASGGTLNHLGFRLPDSASLVAMQRRLEEAGIRSRREEGVECCYALQTKFWVTDPDETLWELYTLQGNLEHRGRGQTREEMLPQQQQANGQENPSENSITSSAWEHRLGQPVPTAIPLADGSVRDVLLRGTFNQPLDDGVKEQLLREAYRVLQPGGKLFVHVLVGERPLSSAPQLPGPAAAVQHTPHEGEPPALLARAGFERIEMTKFSARPCFTWDGVPLRELQLVGYKAARTDDTRRLQVLYKGPFPEIRDDAGRIYSRGQRAEVDEHTAEALRRSPLANQFVYFDSE